MCLASALAGLEKYKKKKEKNTLVKREERKSSERRSVQSSKSSLLSLPVVTAQIPALGTCGGQ
jgi:hypothetical protein